MNPSVEKNLPAILEALLFTAGEPVRIKRLAELMDTDTKTIEQALSLLRQNLNTRGIQVLQKDALVQLVTAPSYASYVERLVKEDFLGDLSKAALETLTIVTYYHPIPRAQIDYIRGVNSSFTIRNLLARGLIERTSQKGAGYLYQPTMEFMRHMGITSLSDLPEYETTRKEFARGIELVEEN